MLVCVDPSEPILMIVNQDKTRSFETCFVYSVAWKSESYGNGVVFGMRIKGLFFPVVCTATRVMPNEKMLTKEETHFRIY